MSENSARATEAALAGSLTNAEKVRAFHELIGEAPPVAPSYPDDRLLALRRKLIEEEHEEVMEALDRLSAAKPEERERRFAAAAHELADLLYVTYGALLWFGIDADEVFAEVHGANLRKTAGPKREDGKQLKPPGWRPADVAAVIERQRGRARRER
jgi:predicted HAD superfamily Cof-like phosphohydrolase